MARKQSELPKPQGESNKQLALRGRYQKTLTPFGNLLEHRSRGDHKTGGALGVEDEGDGTKGEQLHQQLFGQY